MVELLTLAECRRRLETSMQGKVPSLISLKRWSATGEFGKGKVSIGKMKPMFDLAVVARVAAEHALVREDRAKAVLAAGVPTEAGVEGVQHSGRYVGTQATAAVIERAVERLSERLGAEHQELAEKLVHTLGEEVRKKVLGEIAEKAVNDAVSQISGELKNAINSVEAIRRSLMGKYDAEAAALREQVSTLTATNSILKKEAQGLDVARVTRVLNGLEQQVIQLRAEIAELGSGSNNQSFQRPLQLIEGRDRIEANSRDGR